jgi:hypothetical protein
MLTWSSIAPTLSLLLSRKLRLYEPLLAGVNETLSSVKGADSVTDNEVEVVPKLTLTVSV